MKFGTCISIVAIWGIHLEFQVGTLREIRMKPKHVFPFQRYDVYQVPFSLCCWKVRIGKRKVIFKKRPLGGDSVCKKQVPMEIST